MPILQSKFSEAKPDTCGTDISSSCKSLSEKTKFNNESIGAQESTAVVIVHRSRLFRDCLKRALKESRYEEIYDYSEPTAATSMIQSGSLAVLLVGLTDDADGGPLLDLILEQVGRGVHVVVTGESEDPRFVASLLAKGINGYIPSSLDLDVTIRALELVIAGGVYVPGGYLVKLWQSSANMRAKRLAPEDLTLKEMAVVDAIRKGKSNKLIAYELNMCEATVKVHVRNIMKKMRARNRTHAVYLANQMHGEEISHGVSVNHFTSRGRNGGEAVIMGKT
jgi:DNA-binding NarL/FixJ family response regulator